MIDTGLIRVGDIFKLNAANAKGWYTVVSEPNEKGELEVKGDEAHVRTVRVNQLTQRKNALGIISESVEKVGSVWDTDIFVEDVKYMPDHKRRGRKPQGK